ncbi:MAG: divergent polysaccharide deacetylase family protein, partial [Syntrophales bacterium]
MKRLFMFFLIMSAIVAGLWWLYNKPAVIPRKPQGHTRPKVLHPESRRLAGKELHPGKSLSQLEPSISHRKIAIIIDDIGNVLLPVEELIKIDAPLTFSILPHCPYSISSAEDIHRAKREILLHLPMEPLSYPRV